VATQHNVKRATAAAFASLAILSALACLLVQRNGWTLYYGDAEAHLEIARRIVDSRTPGYREVGAVWLPLPHALMLPLVGKPEFWRTGLAGTIPSAICFVLGGTFLFTAARRAFQSIPAAAAAIGVFALNPNLLYLQATPMTEAIFFASLLALLYFTILYRDTQSYGAVLGAGLATFAATLTRYEGWFLIPFVTIYLLFAGSKHRLTAPLMYGAIACLGPLLWILHNMWWFGDPLDFYRGPYSAKAIYQHALDHGLARYPGDHDWRKAIQYYFSAAQQVTGWIAVGLGLCGAAIAIFRRAVWPLFLLALPPVFYVWSIYSSGTPIFVPNLTPFAYYNTRYGLAALPFLAFASGALVFLAPRKRHAAIAVVLALIAAGWWVAHPQPENWICWKESQVNSEARRFWTHETAAFLDANYHGGGIFTMLGDLAGVFREAGIPMTEALNDGNEPQWDASVARPDYFLHERWAVAQTGDPVSSAMAKAGMHGTRYKLVDTIRVKGVPVIEIYRRDSDANPIH